MGFDPVSYIIGRRVGQAAADPLKSWSELQLWLRAGQLGQVLEAGDQLNVEVGGLSRDFDVLGLDEDAPVGSGLSHVLTLQSHDVLVETKFDNAQYLFAVTAEACAAFGWPSSGMPAGTYHIILDRGGFGSVTGQDGTYQFTTTVPVPVGGGVRHTTMGAQQSGGYKKTQITGGTFLTYAADTLTVLESDLSCTEGNGGTCLGTASASTAYKAGDFINFTTRQRYGTSRWSASYLRQLLNSPDETLRWTPATIWSRNAATAPEGFLHRLDPELRSVLCQVRTRYALGPLDGGGSGQYEDVTDYVKIPTLLDINGSAVSGVSEGPVDAEGNLMRSTPYAMWQEMSRSADRIKRYGGDVSNWFLASRGAQYSFQISRVTAAGEITDTFPTVTGIQIGAAPCLYIG